MVRVAVDSATALRDERPEEIMIRHHLLEARHELLALIAVHETSRVLDRSLLMARIRAAEPGLDPVMRGEPLALGAMYLMSMLDPTLHARIRALIAAFRQQPLIHPLGGMTLLAGHAQIVQQPPLNHIRVPRHPRTRARRPTRPRRQVLHIGVLDHRRARYAKFPGNRGVAHTVSIHLPDTLLHTHRCRHFLPSREPVNG